MAGKQGFAAVCKVKLNDNSTKGQTSYTEKD